MDYLLQAEYLSYKLAKLISNSKNNQLNSEQLIS